jgi:integrase
MNRMAEEDIYGNKKRYERMRADWSTLLKKLGGPPRLGKRRYYCRNQANLIYFERLHDHFESRDTSYVRRLRVLRYLLFLTNWTDKDLADCVRSDVDRLVAEGHKTHHTPTSKVDFLKAVKSIWKTLFPVLDEEGRVDDTVVPHPVRHLGCRVEKSRERLRNDRLSFDEIKQLVAFFSADPRMQAYVTLALESLGRPQEMCYTRVGDVELHEGYGRVWVRSHGKEGAKFL